MNDYFGFGIPLDHRVCVFLKFLLCIYGLRVGRSAVYGFKVPCMCGSRYTPVSPVKLISLTFDYDSFTQV